MESLIAKISASGISKTVKGAVCMVGKQVLERGTKEALDNAFRHALAAPLANLTIIEQALFALHLSKEETDGLEEFLKSPSFENLIRAIGLLAVTDKSSMSEQEAALRSFLGRALPGKPDGVIGSLSSAIIELVERVAPEAWQTATDLGALGQTWSSESIIQSLVADQISNARNQLEERIAATSASFREVDRFAGRYKRAVSFATSRLKPQAINESPSVPVADLYVEPLVNFVGEKGVTACHRDMLFASSRRSVLLGNPGGGKSTLAGKLCYDICSDLLDPSALDVPELAAQVVLRDYAQEQKIRPTSIIEYLEAHSKREFQIEPPAGAFKLLLLSGRVLVIFDGLDELIEIKDRSNICSAVSHFAMEYPVAPILVTSREVGYEQAPLDGARFRHFKLNPFNDKQVEEYATKWFKYSCSPNLKEGDRLARAFVAESSIVPDIRSNPLMLGLLCNLYRQDGFIPKNRPDVYQRCADLLFTKWDRSRGIRVKLPLDHRLRPAMSFLAHWIYSDEQLQAGVTEDRLVSETSKYLRQWVEDDAEADGIAQEFITFFRGRAWVFTDTGSDKIQRLYQFTHRTFLEYFAADELVRLHPAAKDLHKHLISKIKVRAWDVVCQLAYQLAVQRTPANDTLVDLLCQDARAAQMLKKLNILSFLARSIDLMYPKPHSRREAVRLCLDTVFEGLLPIDRAGGKQIALAQEILDGILGTSEENLKINASEVNGAIRRAIASEKLTAPAKSALVLLSSDLASALSYSPFGDRNLQVTQFWTKEAEALAEQIRSETQNLSEAEMTAAVLSWWRMDKTSEEILRKFGLPALSTSVYCPVVCWGYIPILAFLVTEAFSMPPVNEPNESGTARAERANWLAKELRSLGKLLSNYNPRPGSIGVRRTTRRRESRSFMEQLVSEEAKWPQDGTLAEGILVCLAVTVELEGVLFPEQSGSPDVRADLYAFVNSQTSEKCKTRAGAMVEMRCAPGAVKEKLLAWVRGEFLFTRRNS
jgi:hypothetical protein